MKKTQYPLLSFLLRMGVVAACLMCFLCFAALVRGSGSALAAFGLLFVNAAAALGANNLEQRIARIKRRTHAQLRVAEGGKLPVRVA